MRHRLSLLVAAVVLAMPADAAELTVSSWLRLGPAPLPLPALHDDGTPKFGPAELLAQDLFPREGVEPRDGDAAPWFPGVVATWGRTKAGDDGRVSLEAPSGTAVAFLAARLETDRFRKLDLTLLGSHPRRAWLDGEAIVSGGTTKEGPGAEAKGSLSLTTGRHLLLVETVFDPDRGGTWSAGATLAVGEGKDLAGLAETTARERDLDIVDVLDAPRVTSLAVSPDGVRVAIGWTRGIAGSDDAESWIEVRATSDGAVRASWRGASISGAAWAPDGKRLTYTTTETKGDKKLTTLWAVNLDDRSPVALLERVENFSGYRWSPGGSYVVYSATVKEEPDKRGVKLYRNLLDRQADWRDRQYLHVLTVPGGMRRRITAGGLSTGIQGISPDGSRLLFLRQVPDVSERPYSKQELWEVDLATLDARKLRVGPGTEAAQYSPDGKKLLIQGGPSEFGGVGKSLPKDMVPNEADGELYVWDPEDGSVDPITKGFDPAVLSARWNRADGNIYLEVAERDYETLWRFEPATRKFTKLDSGVDVIETLDVADRAPVAVVAGSAPWDPQRVRAVDLDGGPSRELAAYAVEALRDTRRGTIEPFSFRASSGRTIDGRVYLPPGFDPKGAGTYPALVYYYGGVTPISREWGGRYPKEWWASQGYVVYVLQPSGATGYGQAFSALHVNDWGEIVTKEIVEGTDAFLKAHPYVDPKRVGCLGASYGGFTTMLLITKTDRFAAAVSHAGISQIADYWGEGNWGYWYNAISAAGSFPWNRQDIYVGRSALYRADKITTPLLLTHGGSDTNVPVGESDALYTALKILGKPVEFLEVEGQDHWIVDHAKRIVWSRSIVAWFDRWLKDRPEWWEALYPATAPPR